MDMKLSELKKEIKEYIVEILSEEGIDEGTYVGPEAADDLQKDPKFAAAKDKKSFILYCDQQGLFNKLPDEIAGKLIKHIFAYVNDEDPIASDLLLEIAFEPIKLQLKRDLRKYDDYIDKQRLNGAKGGRPSKPTETQITQPFFQEPKKADNVNGNENDNDNDNATNKKGFVKPTIEQLKEYMSEQGMNDIAEVGVWNAALNADEIAGLAKGFPCRLARPSSGHGMSVDLIIADEVFGIDSETLDIGLLPTQRARPNPLCSMWSTAGTEDSIAMLRWREQGIRAIDSGEVTNSVYLAEYSPPPDLDPMSEAALANAKAALEEALAPKIQSMLSAKLQEIEELRQIVAKNLAKDINYYVKNGQFGVKGLGYITDAPGLGEPKPAKGKHKASGYGDLKESVLRSQIYLLVKEILAEGIHDKDITSAPHTNVKGEMGDYDPKARAASLARLAKTGRVDDAASAIALLLK